MLSDRPTRWGALRASVSLSALFLVVYGACNHITSLRSDVGSWVYGWERHIPFVPLMIVPYLSIDLFFVAAPFLCTGRRELRQFSWRVVLAVCVAGAFFLAMPLRFTFERPHAGGVLGAVFDWFREMDKPFNQFPSLHIALRTILADLYARHLRTWARVASDVWFSLIGASTLLVYQHHVADVAGGFALAALCFYVFGDAGWRSPVAHDRRVGAMYAAATLVLLAAALWLRPWGLLLLWPAAGTLLLTAAYFGLGHSVYRKAGGRLPLSARVVMGPVLAGQELSRRYYARRSNSWDRVTDRVWVGRVLAEREAVGAREQGVTAVLDLTSEFGAPAAFRALHYLNLPILDLTAPLDADLERAVAFIEEHCGRGAVYVHCKAGYSRSAAVVATYLLHTGAADTPEAAVEKVRAARPGIVIRPEALEAIRAFHAARAAAGTNAPADP